MSERYAIGDSVVVSQAKTHEFGLTRDSEIAYVMFVVWPSLAGVTHRPSSLRSVRGVKLKA